MRIDIATAQQLVSNYKQNHWAAINQNCISLDQNPVPGIKDSRSVWFSLDELNDFISCGHELYGHQSRYARSAIERVRLHRIRTRISAAN